MNGLKEDIKTMKMKKAFYKLLSYQF